MKHPNILKAGVAPLALGFGLMGSPAFAQDSATVDAAVESEDSIVVTGSRIVRPNLEAASPIAVVSGEEVVEQADITVEQYLNTLPQVNAAGTTTSNNPPNGGQANIDLRGLGANRNLVLVDGRRPMVSQANQTVDVNTIPQALIERIDLITGGAGAAYGADAVAGVVNFIMKDDFEGIDLRATYANTIPETDSQEYQISAVIGGNFAEGRGNVALAFDYSSREELGKVQRPFSVQATSTTPTPPTGRYVDGNNAPTQAAINAVFGSYGSLAKDIPVAGSGLIAFNSDNTLFGAGTFNNPRDVTNFRYGANSQTAAPNLNYFPDFYSYNFDIVNVLVLPLERKSAFAKANYEIVPQAEVFVQGGYTEYTSATGSAPTPLGVAIENPCGNVATRAKSALVNCNSETTGARATVTGLVVPTTNPFIPADLRTLLLSRTGNDPALAGSGATEPFRLAYRFLPTGLRRSEFDTQVKQVLGGLRGEVFEGWNYELSYSWGETIINTTLTGGVNVQQVQRLLEAADGGASLCAGGFNPFGIQPLSDACVTFVDELATTRTKFTQKILQGYVTGELAQLPGGPATIVLGAEQRKFTYVYDPGSLSGPIAGPNTGTADNGNNQFTDIFGELLLPITDGLEVNLTARNSKAEFFDNLAASRNPPTDEDGSSSDWSYGATVTFEPIDVLRLRAGYQRAVRAPNFNELFVGGSSFPQYFDPCSITSNYRTTGGTAATNQCIATGLSATAAGAYVQTPGSQVFTTIAGNTNLQPEKADTFTVGGVFSMGRFTASVDYYNITINDTILPPNPNALIAACYGYHQVASTAPYCAAITGNRTPDISQLLIPASLGGNATGAFQNVNGGQVSTSGIDVQLGYNLPTPFAGEDAVLRLNALANYLISYKVEELPGLDFEYADTVAFFGAGLGQTFPRWKGVFNAEWDFGSWSFDTRVRYIDAMKNRAEVIFPGESSFTGTPAVWYVDAALQAEFEEHLTLRIGLTNVFDKQPPVYAPNVQSGTDPSVFDVIGRRAYVQARLRF
jgi:iron complex outermembrane recepter protein